MRFSRGRRARAAGAASTGRQRTFASISFACAMVGASGLMLLEATSAPVAAGEAPDSDVRTILNLGHAGDTTVDVWARLEQDVVAREPDLVILLVGTNDLLNSRKAVSLETYRANLSELVERITAANIDLILVTIPPAYAPYLEQRHGTHFYGSDGPTVRIRKGNDVIHEIAHKYAVPVVEFFDAVERAGGATAEAESLIRNAASSGKEDGVHPTAAGYRLLAALIADVIVREELQDCRRIVCLGDSITRGVHVVGEGTATGETYPAFLARALDIHDR